MHPQVNPLVQHLMSAKPATRSLIRASPTPYFLMSKDQTIGQTQQTRGQWYKAFNKEGLVHSPYYRVDKHT